MATEKILDRSNTLANDHWGYIEGLLRAHTESDTIITAIKYHYLTAFVHGYKHALEDVDARYYHTAGMSAEEFAHCMDYADLTAPQPVECPAVYGGGS